MDRPARKPNRLRNYDYSAPGAYFLTICTYDRQQCLSTIVTVESESRGTAVGALHEAPAVCHTLTPEEECVRRSTESTSARWPGVSVDRYVIMPNHVHMLVRIHEDRSIRESTLQGNGKRSLISKVIGYLKMTSSRDVHDFRPGPLWQRSYYDHVIRNEAEYAEIAEYIGANPARWGSDRFFV